MPHLEDLLKNDTAKGAAIGAGVFAVAVLAVPVLFRAAKPLVRGAVKTALLAGEKAREAFAEAGEALEDVVAEVQAELAEERAMMDAAVEEVEQAAEEA
jgi:hypothetical protein